MFFRLVAYSLAILFFNNSVQAEPVIEGRGNCIKLVNGKPSEFQICSTERWSGEGNNFIKYKFERETFLVRQESGEKRIAYLSDAQDKKEIKIEVVHRYLDTLKEIKDFSSVRGKHGLCYTTLNKKNGFCGLPVPRIVSR
ncbi:hypothetical protein BEN74_04075 [Acinetobacter sp. WCHAc010034]|uniref:hypothetical protein n=1 Tax=Acinetobacter sp. WCHAc010034 TaxID=1879049 RepID=UPI00083AFE3E|nr:hypothetical protein [Acinetobacter sp. WCHAc010034]AYA02125.1 hypothetical protein BEN74_04075 [Acinetobacter sp. WCHAc010034]